jgi:hypothetical protein
MTKDRARTTTRSTGVRRAAWLAALLITVGAGLGVYRWLKASGPIELELAPEDIGA